MLTYFRRNVIMQMKVRYNNLKELIFNENLNILEEESFEYHLVDTEQPQLYREIYPYSEIPKIAFNHRNVAKKVPSSIWITDTTFRDGQQANVPYSVEQIYSIFKMLHELGGPNGIIKQSEFFVYSKKDREAVYKCLEAGFEFPEITTWIRATKNDLELVKNLNIRETGVLISCSDYHIFNKLKMNRKEAFDHYTKIVDTILDFGIAPRCHFEDVTRADFYGFVVPLVSKFMQMSKQANIPIKIRLCDTLGLGFPFTGSILPRSVPGLISGLQHFSDVPSELIEWHGHNDFYFGVANAVAAWLYGASSVNCSLFGIGERTGNVPLEAMAIQYTALRGTTNGMDLSKITEIANYFKTELKYTIPPMTPFVGSDL